MRKPRYTQCTNCGSLIGMKNRCGKPIIFPLGLCQKCYTRYKKFGDPNIVKHVMGEHRAAQPEYRIWSEMIARCENPNNKSFARYGGRGIKVSKEWHDYAVFIKDMGPRPEGKMQSGRAVYSLDRIDNNGDYCKENCRWATDSEQAANKRNNTESPGVSYNKKDRCWRARMEIMGKYVLSKNFIKYEDAVEARKKAETEFLGKEISSA